MTDTQVPIGPPVDATPAQKPQRRIIEGRTIRLEPLTPAHARDLYDATHGADAEEIWRYLFFSPFADFASFEAFCATAAKSDDPVPYAIIDRTSGKATGFASLMRIDAANRVIEVGGITYGPALRRTTGSTEVIYLLARYVFDDLGYRRFEWKCNDLNAPSKRAALRFGFSYEGVFRQHMIVKGRNRDTAWFSLLDREWPARRAAFEAWLAPDNFDASGRQKLSLGQLSGTGSV